MLILPKLSGAPLPVTCQQQHCLLEGSLTGLVDIPGQRAYRYKVAHPKAEWHRHVAGRLPTSYKSSEHKLLHVSELRIEQYRSMGGGSAERASLLPSLVSPKAQACCITQPQHLGLRRYRMSPHVHLSSNRTGSTHDVSGSHLRPTCHKENTIAATTRDWCTEAITTS